MLPARRRVRVICGWVICIALTITAQTHRCAVAGHQTAPTLLAEMYLWSFIATDEHLFMCCDCAVLFQTGQFGPATFHDFEEAPADLVPTPRAANGALGARELKPWI